MPLIFIAIPGCPSGPFLAGEITVFDDSGQGGRICIIPSLANDWSVTVCCAVNPTTHDNAHIGFANDGTSACKKGACFGPISVEDSSWGAIKARY